jgi:hypothetical protein
MSTETPPTDADVARLVALADAATPGPWTAGGYKVLDGAGSRLAQTTFISGDADAAFIAAANPATIKALAARLDALHAENQRLREQVQNAEDYSDVDTQTAAAAITRALNAEAERDALRDAVQTLADEARQSDRHINGYSYVFLRDVERLLSEAGEPNGRQ